MILVLSVAALSPQSMRAGDAKLMFYRTGDSDGHLIHASINVDRKRLYKLPDEHVWECSVRPGAHEIGSDVNAANYQFDPDKTYYFRVQMTKTSQWKNHFHTVKVPQEQAEGEMVGLKK